MNTSNVNTGCSVTKALRCCNNIFISASAFGVSDDVKQYDDDDDDDDTKGGGGWFGVIRDFRYTRYFRYQTTALYKDFTVYSVFVVVVVVVVVCGLSMLAVVIISPSA
jgi:hypothetical protein